MPAKYIKRTNTEGGYFHIFNRGISGKEIFKDHQDYEIFLSYLNNYLSSANEIPLAKKSFVIRGHVYNGIPHKTKNYAEDIELIVYNLQPNHFHLVLRQITRSSLEKFMRSLCTRYSMYYNKKYKSTGSLFEGPYKSVSVNGALPLLLLTVQIHMEPNDTYSSYQEYLGKRDTKWIKPDVILAFLKNTNDINLKKCGDYKKLVENHELIQQNKDLVEGIFLEKEFDSVVRNDNNLERSIPISESTSKSLHFAISLAVFIILFGFGFKNVLYTSAQNITIDQNQVLSSPTPEVAGVKEETNVITLVEINISDGAESVNVRQKPSTTSSIITNVFNGESFDFVSVDSGWYEIKLPDGSVGFVSAKYAQIKDDTN